MTAAGALTGGAAVATEGVILEPNQPKLVRLEIPLRRWPEAFDGITIAQLSDIHYDDHFSVVPLRHAVAAIRDLRPDLVVITGDFITIPPFNEYLHHAKPAAAAIEPCAQLLRQLHAPLGVVAALGNHDVDSDPERITDTLRAINIPVLRNSAFPLERSSFRIWLAGVDDLGSGKPDMDLTLKSVPREDAVVLLSHEPDYADEVAKYPVDLQLSGHSHGGQIRLPLLGAPWLPDGAKKYPWGLRKIGPVTLYTNAGLGTIRVPVRLNCPPEITLFTLRTLR
ncbi:MAG TPA: metallophosphoesterase [Terriglobales bacterium]|nr:metallophosphoesterase [Terriglobales bacterium]